MIVKNFSFFYKIEENLPPDSLHRVKQGTILPLNIQVGNLGNNLSSPVNGVDKASPFTVLFLIHFT